MIDAAEMQHLKLLARLDLDDAETEQMRGELNAILEYFALLQELNTEGVPEMQRPVALSNVMREDAPGEMLSQAQALALAVEEQDGFFKVPRTVE